LILVGGEHSKGKAAEKASSNEPPPESLLCLISGVDVGEVMNEPLNWDDGDTALVPLGTSSDEHGERRGEDGTEDHVVYKGELILVLNVLLVLPRPPLWAGHIFPEAGCHPSVAQELIVQPLNIM